MLKKLLVFICIFCSAYILHESKCFAKGYKFEDIVMCETDRLVLEPTTESDLDILSAYLMDFDVAKYLDPQIKGSFSSKEEALNFLKGEGECDIALEFTIKLKDSKIPIGKIDAMIYYNDNGNIAMFGYWLGKEYQGKGYAREASYNFCNKVFNASDVSVCYISCLYGNVSGCRLANDILEYLEKHNTNLKLSKEKEQLDIKIEQKKSIIMHIFQLKKVGSK